jgi:hypothetical protein
VTVDPFGDPDTAAVGSGDFLTNEELIGRHLIVVPKTVERIKGEGTWPDGRAKSDYDRMTVDIIVLDGRKHPKIAAFPHLERDKYISAYSVVKALKAFLPGSGDPERQGKACVGYFGMAGKAYSLDEAPDVKAAPSTRQAWERYQAANSAPEPTFAAPQPPAPPF